VYDDNFYTKDPDEAMLRAMRWAMAGGEARLDVLVSSEAGAEAYGGDDAVEQYLEDPEASVFARFEVRVNAQGRIAAGRRRRSSSRRSRYTRRA
jgi:predicted DNA-binding protein